LATDRLVTDHKHPLYRCANRTYLAIFSANQAGLSIRKIASATGLSSSGIHYLFNPPEANEIPVWLSRLRLTTMIPEHVIAMSLRDPSREPKNLSHREQQRRCEQRWDYRHSK
jgi:hypothetical protein